MLGRLERHASELGGTCGKRVHGDADTRRDRSANVITVLIDDVDIGRGAKVHHDRRRAVESFGRNGVGDAVGTHGLGARRAQLGHRGRLRPDDDGIRGNAVGHGVPLARELRHHAGKGDRVDRIERKAVHLKETHQAHVDLVGGIGAVGGHTPRLHQLVPVKQAHGRLRVSHIDSEQHVYSRCRRKRTRTIVYVPSAPLYRDSFAWAFRPRVQLNRVRPKRPFCCQTVGDKAGGPSPRKQPWTRCRTDQSPPRPAGVDDKEQRC